MSIYCENCGAKNDENDFFCVECGSPLFHGEEKKQEEAASPKSTEKQVEQVAPKTPRPKKVRQKKSKLFKAIIAIMCIAVISGGGYWGYITFIQKSDVNLVNDATISLVVDSGNVVIDKDATVNSIKVTGVDSSDSDQMAFLKNVTYSLPDMSNVKKGDKIKITATYDHDTAKKLKLNVTNYSKTITVKEVPFRYMDGSKLDQDAYQRALNKAQAKVDKIASKYDSASADQIDSGLFTTKAKKYSAKSWKTCDNLCFLFEVSGWDVDTTYYIVSVYPFDLHTDISKATIGKPYVMSVSDNGDVCKTFEHSTDSHKYIAIENSDDSGY